MVRMFKMNFGKKTDDKGFKFYGYDNFRYFKQDLALKGLHLQTEVKFENGLFYKIQNN